MPRRAHAPGRPPEDDLLRWASFACLPAAAALLWRGASFLTAAGVVCGLAAVTAASRLLIRRSRRLGSPARSSRLGAHPHARRVGALPQARAHAPGNAGQTPAG
ncbi:hypothetical protein [Streptomyces sp. CL7]|uniref:hypothetical protein n=1 Tax=Streptomyces sp. CL7 TaxID=3096006 RepID=UPI002A75074B|nr:hypothetical protein [Streptomyces sp. CL7]WPP29983.1 hypothetical protein SJH97_11850 [Streptomyces sp. CL7]